MQRLGLMSPRVTPPDQLCVPARTVMLLGDEEEKKKKLTPDNPPSS